MAIRQIEMLNFNYSEPESKDNHSVSLRKKSAPLGEATPRHETAPVIGTFLFQSMYRNYIQISRTWSNQGGVHE